MEDPRRLSLVEPGSFDQHEHWYPKVVNATIHPLVQYFFNLSNALVIDRYCHLHPMVRPSKLKELLAYVPKYYAWSGSDLINVTNARGKRQMVVIESNSCPSGQKSMPLMSDQQEQGGYRFLIENSFAPFVGMKPSSKGALAVLYDKNHMENSGYAAAMADYFDRPVWLVPCYEKDSHAHWRFRNDYLEILVNSKTWTPVRAAFRYVTQKPWNRIPVFSRTAIYNPISACLAGGRNKLVASKAYGELNAELKRFGLKIRTPETIQDVTLDQVTQLVKKFGGQAVIKVPYGNAGQGVYTITHEEELKDFLKQSFDYSRFIVQSLVGNYRWSSKTSTGKYYHLGTIPNAMRQAYVYDLRMMVCATPEGFRPVSVYSRRAEKPLKNEIKRDDRSWDMLGTNLSHKDKAGNWTTDTHRLLMMDRRDFNVLGLGLDDLIEAYIQTVLANIAIDQMAQKLVNSKGQLRRKLFTSMNDDPFLMDEIM